MICSWRMISLVCFSNGNDIILTKSLDNCFRVLTWSFTFFSKRWCSLNSCNFSCCFLVENYINAKTISFPSSLSVPPRRYYRLFFFRLFGISFFLQTFQFWICHHHLYLSEVNMLPLFYFRNYFSIVFYEIGSNRVHKNLSEYRKNKAS